MRQDPDRLAVLANRAHVDDVRITSKTIKQGVPIQVCRLAYEVRRLLGVLARKGGSVQIGSIQPLDQVAVGGNAKPVAPDAHRDARNARMRGCGVLLPGGVIEDGEGVEFTRSLGLKLRDFYRSEHRGIDPAHRKLCDL